MTIYLLLIPMWMYELHEFSKLIDGTYRVTGLIFGISFYRQRADDLPLLPTRWVQPGLTVVNTLKLWILL